ncbi:MAG: hypothetical protein FJ316_09610 [SAR202 cluster bacterium]|nr:hypothetical protein [SAR202 cluster bacterium]
MPHSHRLLSALILWAAALLLASGCGPGATPAPQGAAPPSTSAAPNPSSPISPATITPTPLLGSVKSSDGTARIDVPEGSLPEGVRLSDIKIGPVDAATLPVQFPNGPALAAYKLEPDGAKFT